MVCCHSISAWCSNWLVERVEQLRFEPKTQLLHCVQFAARMIHRYAMYYFLIRCVIAMALTVYATVFTVLILKKTGH